MPRTAHQLVETIALAMGLVALVPAGARAEDNPEAKSLYLQGQKLHEQKRYDEACPVFERSLAIDPTPRTRGALAICYEDAGLPASAWLTWRSVATQAQDAGPREAARARRALQKMEQLRPRLTMAIFKIAGGATDVTVIVDGRTLTMNEIGLPIPIDPGLHVVEAKADGHADWRSRFDVDKGSEGSSLTVSVGPLTRLEKVDEPPPPDPVETAEPVEPAVPAVPALVPVEKVERRTPTLKYVGVAAAGAGVVALGVGTFFALSARSAWNDAKKMGCNDDGLCPTQPGADRVNDASSKARVSKIALGSGIGLAAGGALLWFLTPREERVTRTMTPSVSIGSGGAQLGVKGSF